MCFLFFISVIGFIAMVPVHFLSVEHHKLQQKYGEKKGTRIGDIYGLLDSAHLRLSGRPVSNADNPFDRIVCGGRLHPHGGHRALFLVCFATDRFGFHQLGHLSSNRGRDGFGLCRPAHRAGHVNFRPGGHIGIHDRAHRVFRLYNFDGTSTTTDSNRFRAGGLCDSFHYDPGS